MATELDIASLELFPAMKADERHRVLMELQQRLQASASLSHQLKSRHWQQLEKIGNRISRDHEELANDYSEKSLRFISDAIHALDEFAMELGSYNRHPSSRT